MDNITVTHLGKAYKQYPTHWTRLAEWLDPRDKPRHHLHWVLQDINFTVNPGETVGIIGRNGAGKSTLLKMITGTISPTTGSIEKHGRVAALLELGMGFHPDFTGRQNVIMSAQLLGLSVAEIQEKMPAIEAFADIGDYFDQPVRVYSSGMYVRVAFALIAHVDADTLIIDEALAVGDAVFIQKCMRFIRQFQERGTMLFVSHDMSAVQNLCQRAIWLDGGSVRMLDSAKSVAEEYLRFTLQQVYGQGLALEKSAGESVDAKDPEAASDLSIEAVPDNGGVLKVIDNLAQAKGWRTGVADLLAVTLHNLSRPGISMFEGGERVRMSIRARAREALDNPIVGFLWRDRLGQDLFGENTLPFTNETSVRIPADSTFSADFEFILPMLPNGEYSVMASVGDGTLHSAVQHHFLHDALIVQVASSKVRWGLVGIPFSRIHLGLTS